MSVGARRTLAIAVPVLLAAAGWTLPGTASAFLLYPLLGVLPGLVIARALPIERGALARLALGLAAGPLVTAVLGWLLLRWMPIAAASATLAAAALLLWSVSVWRRPPGLPTGEPGARFALAWSALWAALVAAPLLINPWLRIRSDSWTHAGIVQEILTRGIPPEDPRFAGLPLNYVWFYNLFLALAAALRGHDPFALIPLFNAVTLGATLLLAWLIGRRLWGEAGARGCALLAAVGFNAGVWLLWPLRLVRAAFGQDRGWDEVRLELDTLHLGDSQVIWSLSAPFAHMASFLDKYLIGTAVAYAYLMASVWLWALVAWLEQPAVRHLAWLAIAASAMLLFHGVIGLSFVPVALATLVAAALLASRGAALPDFRRLAPPALATLAGALAAAPYTFAISRGWSPAQSGLQFRYLEWDWRTAWTLASATLVAAWIARRSVRRALAERREAPLLLALLALGLAAFALIVKLPIANHVKFAYQTFVPIALLGGVALADEAAAWKQRLGRPAAVGIAVLLFAAPPALTLAGYFADPSGETSALFRPAPDEQRLFEWVRRNTAPEAVFVDRNFRSVLMVRAGRQLWLGAPHGPELAAFPEPERLERARVMADLYGARDSLERDARALAALGRPAYVLVRASDTPGVAPTPLDPGRRWFEPVYDEGGFVVYHLQPPAESGASR